MFNVVSCHRMPVFLLYICAFLFDVAGVKKYGRRGLISLVKLLKTRGGIQEIYRIMWCPGYISPYEDSAEWLRDSHRDPHAWEWTTLGVFWMGTYWIQFRFARNFVQFPFIWRYTVSSCPIGTSLSGVWKTSVLELILRRWKFALEGLLLMVA